MQVQACTQTPKHACTPCTNNTATCLPTLQSLASSPGCQPQWKAFCLGVSSSKAPRLRSRPACLPACLPARMLTAACHPPDCLAVRLPTYRPTYLHKKQQPLPSGSSYTLLAKLAAPYMACLAATALVVIASNVVVLVASSWSSLMQVECTLWRSCKFPWRLCPGR